MHSSRLAASCTLRGNRTLELPDLATDALNRLRSLRVRLMPSPFITRQGAAELSGLPLAAVKNAIDKQIVPDQAIESQSFIETGDVVTLVMLPFLGELPVDQKRRVRD